MLRWIVRALAIIVIAVATLVVLDFAELLVPVGPDDSASMANTIPACDGRVLAQGLTYRWFTDPSRDDVVAVHAAETDDGEDRSRPRCRRPRARAARRRRPRRCRRGPRGNRVRQRAEVRRHHDQAVSSGERPERAVLPARRQPLGGDRQPNVRPGPRRRDLRQGVRRRLAASRHHVPPRPELGRAAGRSTATAAERPLLGRSDRHIKSPPAARTRRCGSRPSGGSSRLQTWARRSSRTAGRRSMPLSRWRSPPASPRR